MNSLRSSQAIAHRGASAYAPENTLASLLKAYELGAKWVECDVMLTKDHEPIIFHDDTFSRTTNGDGQVRQAELEQVQNLDAGGWFNVAFQQEPVPTLAQWLQMANELGLHLNLELKGHVEDINTLVQQTVHCVQQYWTPHSPMLLYSSADRYCLQALRHCVPEAPIGLISDVWMPDWLEQLSALGCCSWHVNANQLTSTRVQEVASSEFALLAYTVNDVMRAHELLALGVTAFFTDDPLLVTAL